MHDPNPASGRTEREIFSAALERSTPGDRAAFLDEACGGDMNLRRRLEALLARHFEQDSFMQDPAMDQLPTVLHDPLPTEEPGTLIGRYKLLEKLGEGGFGAVWAAEQREPVRRRVALKVIKLGMDTKAVALAGGLHEVEHRIDQFPIAVLPGAPSTARFGKAVVDEAPFSICQIRGVSHPQRTA
jgi:hypothetical protein